MSISSKPFKKGVCWLRRDLRLHDHRALSEACTLCHEIEIVFVFDPFILNKIFELAHKFTPQDFDDSGHFPDQRIEFLLQGLSSLQKKLEEKGGTLLVRYGDPQMTITHIIQSYEAEALFFNRDYEPSAVKRDSEITEKLEQEGISVFSYKDHVIFEQKEITKGDGTPYQVFTPYKKRWLEAFENLWDEGPIPSYRCKELKNTIRKKSATQKSRERIQKEKWQREMGFAPFSFDLKVSDQSAISRLSAFARHKLSHYEKQRDFPSRQGTSELSPFIRHGFLSIRQIVNAALKERYEGHQSWLNELIWRDFYQMILSLFPHVQEHSFKPQFQNIKWKGKNQHFKLWALGQTGFPLVDAAMRCLNQTGLMPNRLRMLTASFLCKTLLLNWQWGERYFALKLLDYDLAANNGGWQWAASTGCDAQPYFRIFNPYTQSQKFDPEGEFIRKYCPELVGFSNKHIHSPHTTTEQEQEEAHCQIGRDYPSPIVDYKSQRDVAMKMYQETKEKNSSHK